MRLIVIGTEYVGKTTLINSLQTWGTERGFRYHLDDHFSIPDCQMLKSAEDQQVMLGLPEIIKERFQRFQVAYHVRLLGKYENIILGGFHIEEHIYGSRYYYPDLGIHVENPQSWEAGMPPDIVMVLLTADPDVIRQRMKDDPHDYPVVPESDIEEVQEAFRQEYRRSWIKRRFEIDTTSLTPHSLLDRFLQDSVPFLETRDLLIRMNSKS